MIDPLLHKKVMMKCTMCGTCYAFGFLLRCPTCKGLIDPVYEMKDVILFDSLKPLERYFHLIPLQKLSSALFFGEGNTPCIHAQRLGRQLGMERLYLKNETYNKTGTTKDRMAACVLSYFSELGINEFVVSSTGNSSTAFAYDVQRMTDMRLHLFCARSFLHRHDYCDSPRIKLHIIDGDFVQASKAAQQFATEHNIVFEGGFFNLARREGLKLAYLEAFDQLDEEPAVIVQAVSSGMGMYGAYRGIKEYQTLGKIKQMPRLVCAQQETCAPMYQAYRDNSSVIRPGDIVHNPTGIAEAILRGDPSQAYPYLYNVVKESQGCFEVASQVEIQEARQLLYDTEGIDVCYAAATALASAYRLARSGWIKPTEVVLVNLTGSNRHLLAEDLDVSTCYFPDANSGKSANLLA